MTARIGLAGETGVTGRRIAIRGTVQGVGFRPWVFRLAREEGVTGTVRNDSEGVVIDAFGSAPAIERFLERLQHAAPPAAAIRAVASEPVEPPEGRSAPREFIIVPSAAGADREYAIPPDLATCPDCLREVFTTGDRRYLYPFTNCTRCGPRFTITLDLPYDRPKTTMAGFEMCPCCRAEYEDPLDRRFHAQPNACPACGPRLRLLDPAGVRVATSAEAIPAAARAIRDGSIVAVKGLGGFQLIVLASDDRAVERLRRRKRRWEKPLALMARDLDEVRRLCRVGAAEAELLSSPEAPIVLLDRLPDGDLPQEGGTSGSLREGSVAVGVAPGNPRLGVMLPATALHHLLLAAVGEPVVATSGNLSDEPIAIDDREAFERLGGIADLFLTHDRPIARHADDSVVVRVRNRTQIIRRARGYAPRGVSAGASLPTLLAVGGHMKNAVAVSRGRQVVLSQHIGDMETPQAMAAFESVIEDLLRMLDARPEAVVHDLHPDYPSTVWAERILRGLSDLRRAGVRAVSDRVGESGSATLSGRLRGLPAIAVQHHHAHLAACLADNGVDGRALGLTLDGTGYGADGTVWGGEALLGDARSFERVARLRPFRLLGGEVAVREPRRPALAVLADTFGSRILEGEDFEPTRGLDAEQRRLLTRLLRTGLGSPWTSSAGRLFDAVAAIVGLHQTSSFEGQAAMSLEFAATRAGLEDDGYPIDLDEAPADPDGDRKRATGEERGRVGPSGASPAAAPAIELDWRPMIEAIVADLHSGVDTAVVAARFHNGLAAALRAVAERIGEPRVALTGGCFQNALLTERTASGLETAGFEVLLHRRVPANDGGLALGQIAVGAARLVTDRSRSAGPRSRAIGPKAIEPGTIEPNRR